MPNPTVYDPFKRQFRTLPDYGQPTPFVSGTFEPAFPSVQKPVERPGGVNYCPLPRLRFGIHGSKNSRYIPPLNRAESYIVSVESGGDVTAKSKTSTAFGVGQLIAANRQKYGELLGINPDTTDYEQQVALMRAYIADRYGQHGRLTYVMASQRAASWHRTYGTY